MKKGGNEKVDKIRTLYPKIKKCQKIHKKILAIAKTATASIFYFIHSSRHFIKDEFISFIRSAFQGKRLYYAVSKSESRTAFVPVIECKWRFPLKTEPLKFVVCGVPG